MSSDIYKKLGVQDGNNIKEQAIDIDKSLAHEKENILFTENGDIVAYDVLNPKIYEYKSQNPNVTIYRVDEEKFKKLRDYIFSSSIDIQEVSIEEGEEEELVDNSEILRLIKRILIDAKRNEASDIHIYVEKRRSGSGYKRYTVVKLRVDGLLRTYREFPGSYAENIINKIMNMSGMDIGQKRRPQDGKFKEIVDSSYVEARVSTAPTVNGVTAVIRLAYADESEKLKLDDIGFEKTDLEIYRKNFYEPYGMILNVGATGQGKSTTFRLTIEELVEHWKGQKKIATVEDPVEYEMQGVIQHPVDEKMGSTFATLLRSLLRQDPDIIMVGEIRDEETAEIASRASLTGHLVLATLHANDSFEAVMRMKDLGVSPQIIASTLNAILSQRLLRRLCPHCKKLEPISPKIVEDYNLKFDKAYEAKGCDKCGGTGVLGRTAVIEVLEMDERLKEAVINEESSIRLKQIAKEQGFENLWTNGLKKVERGEVSISELLSLVKPDRILNDTSSGEKISMRMIFYPHKLIPLEVAGIGKGYVFDASEKDMSILLENTMLTIGKSYRIEALDSSFEFIPSAFGKYGEKSFVFGGRVRGEDFSRKLLGGKV